MTHIDPERMASFAMSDEEPDAAETAHLAECDVCAAELDALTRAGELARDARGTELVAPPAEVWARIQAELGLAAQAPAGVAGASADSLEKPASSASVSAPIDASASPSAPPAAALDAPDALAGSAALASPAPAGAPDAAPLARPAAATAAASAEAPAPVRAIRGARRPRFWVPLAAAALFVGLVGGVGAGVWWQSTQQAAAGSRIAEAYLAPFPEWPSASGSAVVEQRADGTRQVVIDVDRAADEGTPDAPLREVWLIRTDGTGLISIGFLDGTSGRFDVPAGVDLAQYALVDVSAEPDNGDPTHSGDSIVRGELRGL